MYTVNPYSVSVNIRFWGCGHAIEGGDANHRDVSGNALELSRGISMGIPLRSRIGIGFLLTPPEPSLFALSAIILLGAVPNVNRD